LVASLTLDVLFEPLVVKPGLLVCEILTISGILVANPQDIEPSAESKSRLDCMSKSDKPYVRVTRIEQDIALITMDAPNSSANILEDQLFQQLDSAMATLMAPSQGNDQLAGVILCSAKPKIFVAGADLKRIVATHDWTESEIIRFCEQGRAVMARFSRCPFVSVAAISGASSTWLGRHRASAANRRAWQQRRSGYQRPVGICRGSKPNGIRECGCRKR